MPVTTSYPGVYIEELAAPGQTITGVGTSITAFIGYTRRGQTNRAVQVFNFGEFEREFGGLDPDSPLSYSIRHFFQNGGTEAWVVRVAAGAFPGEIELLTAPGGATALRAVARSDGSWSDALRLDVDYTAANPSDQFNLTVSQVAPPNGAGTQPPPAPEVFENLTMNSRSPRYAPDVVTADSRLIRLARGPSGPLSSLLGATDATSTSGVLSAAVGGLDDDHRRLAVIVDGEGPVEFSLFAVGGAPTTAPTLAAVATMIQNAVRLHPDLSGAARNAFSASATAIDGATADNAVRGTSTSHEDHSEVRFLDAQTANAAGVLRLGLRNGGREASTAWAIRPAANGTLGARTPIDFTALPASAQAQVTITRGATAGTPRTVTLWSVRPTDLGQIATALQAALRGVTTEPELAQASVSVVDGRLRVRPGEVPRTGTDPRTFVEFADRPAGTGGTPALDPTATTLGLAGAARANLHRYTFASGPAVQALTWVRAGADGTPPGATDLTGSEANKTGMYALLDVDLFNILCIPNESRSAVLSEAIALCNRERAFLIIDAPGNLDTMAAARAWANDPSQGQLRDKNAAVFFPRIRAADPRADFRVRPMPASGAIAGVFARTDGERGVWKAPAGSEAPIRGAEGVTVPLTDLENGQLNPIGVNALRVFPAYGTVVWGARTFENTDPWRYIPVRRTALFIEESLYRGTQWCVFEPNDEELWAQIRMNVGAFMHNLFRQGAFQGSEPRQAYQVKCDSETTTQFDIDNGRVNIFVGFAPLKPAEFVIVQIAQLAGQVQT